MIHGQQRKLNRVRDINLTLSTEELEIQVLVFEADWLER